MAASAIRVADSLRHVHRSRLRSVVSRNGSWVPGTATVAVGKVRWPTSDMQEMMLIIVMMKIRMEMMMLMVTGAMAMMMMRMNGKTIEGWLID